MGQPPPPPMPYGWKGAVEQSGQPPAVVTAAPNDSKVEVVARIPTPKASSCQLAHTQRWKLSYAVRYSQLAT